MPRLGIITVDVDEGFALGVQLAAVVQEVLCEPFHTTPATSVWSSVMVTQNSPLKISSNWQPQSLKKSLPHQAPRINHQTTHPSSPHPSSSNPYLVTRPHKKIRKRKLFRIILN